MDILSYVQVGGILFGAQYGYNLFKRCMVTRAANRWANTRKDLVVLHTVGRGRTIPNLSPFSLKVETFLRMAKIDYEIDSDDVCWGPTGKFPWISLNGQHYSDSQLIVELLEQKFEKDFNGNYSEEQLAKATAIRVMLEEHFFFGGIAMWRFVFAGKENLNQTFNLSPMALRIFQTLYGMKIKALTWHQGIGRNSEEDIQNLMTSDLDAVSKLLGSNKFILGDEPCRDDCAIFGILGQVMWGLPGSVYEKDFQGKFSNLKEYCERMKSTFFADWDLLLANAANVGDHEDD